MDQMNMSASQNSAATLPICLANTSIAAPELDDRDSDDWLGCESLHPLTWLPAIPGPAPL